MTSKYVAIGLVFLFSFSCKKEYVKNNRFEFFDNFIIKNLIVELKAEKKFSIQKEREIEVEVEVEVFDDKFVIESLETNEKNPTERRLTKEELKLLKTTYSDEHDWITEDFTVAVINVKPIWGNGNGKRFQTLKTAFYYGGRDLILLEVSIHNKKKFVHWFRPK